MNAPALPASALPRIAAPCRLTAYADAMLAEQRRRWAGMSQRQPGEHPVHAERVDARLEAAEAAVALALAVPGAGLAVEANQAVQRARWGIDDVAELRFGAKRLGEMRNQRGVRAGAAIEPSAVDDVRG